MRKFIALALTVLVALAAAVCVAASPTAPLRQEAVRLQIDILPGVAPNAINLGDIQAVPVAILSTAGFDAASVNAASVTVGGAPVTKTDDGQLSVSRDVNEDGLADVVIYFSPMFTQLDNTSTEAALRGSLNDGTPVEGSDAVQCSGRAPQTASAGPSVAPLATIRLPPALALNLFGDIYNYVASFFAAPAATTQTFSNTANISIPASGNASPYPSNISVSGFPAAEKIKSVTVSLSKINHTAPDDLDILLVGPGGQKFILMSDRGGTNDLVNTNLTFDDAAAALLPVNNIPSGTYRPTNQTNSGDNFSGVATPYLSPAPVGTATLFSAFGGANANGTWSLYVVDDNSGDSGNISGGWSITITTEPSDSTPPTISTPTVAPVEATGPAGAVVNFAAPTANDNVDGAVTPSCDHLSGETFPIGTTTVNCSATDAANNTGHAGFNVVVQDTTAPAFSGTPASNTYEATSAAGALVTFTNPTAADIVSGSVTVSCVSAPTAGLASGSTFPLGLTTVNCSATDAAGNAANTSFSVTVADTQGPVISNVPGNQTLEATSAAGAAATWTDPTATDAVDGARPVVCTPLAGSTFPLGTTTVNCEASDNSSHTSSASFTIKVQDTTAPALTAPANQTAEATSAAGAVVNFPAATATDAVTASPTINYSQNPGTAFPVGTTTVNVSATDAAGNVSNGSFTVTVKDTTAPAMPALSPVNAEATSAAGAVVNYSVGTATDAVDGNVALVCAPASGATFALGATAVNCSATDTAGNASNGSFTVTVSDTTAPALSVPANQVAEATSAAGAAVSYPAATATDAVTSAPEITYSHVSGSVFPLGATTVTVKAKDAAGNESTDTFTVTVEDTTAPIITAPANQTAEATGAAGAAVTFAAPSASDIVDGALTPNCVSAPTAGLASGSTFPLGTTTITCNVSDAADNAAAQKSFTVTVQDTTAPTLSGLTNKTVEATGPAGAVATYSPSATDLVDGGVAVNCSPVSGSTFALGAATVNCSATDAHNNTANGSFTVTVKDTTAPALNLPANVTALAASNSKAAVNYTATATDVVDGSVSVNCAPASGSLFSVGATTVNCSATDAHGNTANGSFTVAVSYNFNGFFQPVDNLPVLNKAQAGSAIPVKFSLGGNQGLSIFATPNSPGSAMVGCGATSLVSEVEQTVTAGGSSLSYDPVANQYVYVWKTDKSWAGTCRQLVVTFADGTVKGANFQFRK